MSFLSRLFGGKKKAEPEDNGLYLYVRCNNCRAVLHTRADPERDASRTDNGWHLTKEMMDDRCFRLIYAEVDFDDNRQVTQAEIKGGTLIDQATWLAEKDLPRWGRRQERTEEGPAASEEETGEGEER
jgi:hypothetical protein